MSAHLVAADLAVSRREPPTTAPRLSVREIVSRDSAHGPWTADQRVALVVGNVLGLAAVVTAWWGASGSDSANRQIAWLDLAIFGVVVAGAVNGVYLLRGYRAVRLARTSIFVPATSASPTSAAARTRSAARGGAERFVFVAGTTRFHRADCALVSGKPTTGGTRTSQEKAGRAACEICQP